MKQTCDALVIGSGIAALTYALEISDSGREVVIVTKREATEANTAYAQGGVAAVLSPEDSFEAHVADTLAAGAGLCHPGVVERVVKDAPAAIGRLIEHGVRFDKSGQQREGGVEFDLTREGGHTHRRVVHAGDITGAEIIRALIAALRSRSNVMLLERHCAIDLITSNKVEALQAGQRFVTAVARQPLPGRVRARRSDAAW